MSQVLSPQPPLSTDTPQTALTVQVAPHPRYEPPPPPPQSAIWRAVKWPLRKLIKAIYLLLTAARRHKILALALLALLVALVGGTYSVYRATHPTTSFSNRFTPGGNASSAQAPETPFTISSMPQPPLPSSVIHALHAFKAHDGHEFWNALDSRYQTILTQSGRDENSWVGLFSQQQSSGITFQQFIYTGGYMGLDGVSYYTVELIADNSGQPEQITLYFSVNANGAIILAQTLAQAPTQTP